MNYTINTPLIKEKTDKGFTKYFGRRIVCNAKLRTPSQI